MKGFIATLVVLILFTTFLIFSNDDLNTESVVVKASVIEKYTGSKIVGKMTQTTYNVKVRYENMTTEIDDYSKYNLLDKGYFVNVNLITKTDNDGKLISKHIEFIH